MAVSQEWTMKCLIAGARQTQFYKTGIYGWRKRCLYFVVLLLLVMVIINFALTIWIIRVLDISINGMGTLKIFRDGVRLEGQSHFLNTLYAAQIQSRKDQELKIESARNITINARNKEGKITNSLKLGHDSITSYSEKFSIRNRAGNTLFQADDQQVVIGSQSLKVTGSGGIHFEGSLQTPYVRSHQQLRLESPTRTLHVKAPEGIGIESRAGDISVSCLKDLQFQSKHGTIWLDSERIELKNLKTALPTTRGRSYPGIYQLCACESGRLFLAPPHHICQADNFVCREPKNP